MVGFVPKLETNLVERSLMSGIFGVEDGIGMLCIL